MENVRKGVLLDNGLDLVFSALEYVESDDPQTLKHVCLNLCEGVDLIFRERLAAEHWSLLFEYADAAYVDALRIGEFKAVDFGTCIRRLENVVGLRVGAHAEVIGRLPRLARQLRYFESDVTKEEVLSILVKSWSCVVEFIESHLRDVAKEQAASIENITEQMSSFDKTIQARLDAIQGDINYHWGTSAAILKCPRCLQATFLVRAAPDKPSCLFCNYSADPEIAVDRWCSEFLGVESPRSIAASPRKFTCPECDKGTLIQPDYSRDNVPYPGWVCFSCGRTWAAHAIDFCECCGHLFRTSTAGDLTCPNCKRFNIEHR